VNKYVRSTEEKVSAERRRKGSIDPFVFLSSATHLHLTMASRQRAEHVVSGILSDVTAACGGRDPPVSPALIGSVVKAVVLHPDNAFGPEKELSDDDLTAITRRCVDRLSDDSDVGVACLALQTDMAIARRTYGQRPETTRDKGQG
jgi:hypothetical protein